MREKLGPGLVRTYCSVDAVEGLDVDKDEFDKFSARWPTLFYAVASAGFVVCDSPRYEKVLPVVDQYCTILQIYYIGPMWISIVSRCGAVQPSPIKSCSNILRADHSWITQWYRITATYIITYLYTVTVHSEQWPIKCEGNEARPNWCLYRRVSFHTEYTSTCKAMLPWIQAWTRFPVLLDTRLSSCWNICGGGLIAGARFWLSVESPVFRFVCSPGIPRSLLRLLSHRST